MNRTLHRIRRIRAYEETVTRMDWAEAVGARDDAAHAVETTEEVLRRSLTEADAEDVTDLARSHAYALRQEMSRRHQVEALDQAERLAQRQHTRWRQADQDHRIADNLVEHVEANLRWTQAQKEQRQLDEVAIAGWWRNNH